MIVQRDKILEIYEKFKNLFQTYFGGDRIYFKDIDTKMLYNIDDWKLFFKEENIDKKGIIKILSTKNNILEQIKTTEEFDNIFSLISKIRNAIKGKTKKSNDETTNLISNIFWNNDLTNEKERKSFLKLYVDFSKTLFNFLINNSNLR